MRLLAALGAARQHNLPVNAKLRGHPSVCRAPWPSRLPPPCTTLASARPLARSLHSAHFKLQRCQDRFAAELGISGLKASAPAPSTAPAAPSGGAAAAAAAAAAAEAQQALAAAGEVPVPGVRELTSESGGPSSWAGVPPVGLRC